MKINEHISVIASFGLPYKLRPVRFRWAGRLYDIAEVTYTWQSREGQSRRFHFAVVAGGTLYELCFNTGSLIWTLEARDEEAA